MTTFGNYPIQHIPTNFRRLSFDDVKVLTQVQNRLYPLKSLEVQALWDKLEKMESDIRAYRPSLLQVIRDLVTFRFFKIRTLRRELPKVIDAVAEIARTKFKIENKPVTPHRSTPTPIKPIAPVAPNPSQPIITTLKPTPTVTSGTGIKDVKRKDMQAALIWLKNNRNNLPQYYRVDQYDDYATGRSRSTKINYSADAIEQAISYLEGLVKKLETVNVPVPRVYHATGHNYSRVPACSKADGTTGHRPNSALDVMESILSVGQVNETEAYKGLGAYVSTVEEHILYGPLSFAIDYHSINLRHAKWWPKLDIRSQDPAGEDNSKYNSVWMRVLMGITLDPTSIAYIVAPDVDITSGATQINVKSIQNRLSQMKTSSVLATQPGSAAARAAKKGYEYLVLPRMVATLIRYAVDNAVNFDLPKKTDLLVEDPQKKGVMKPIQVDLWRRDNRREWEQGQNTDVPGNMKHNPNTRAFEDDEWNRLVETDANYHAQKNLAAKI